MVSFEHIPGFGCEEEPDAHSERPQRHAPGKHEHRAPPRDDTEKVAGQRKLPPNLTRVGPARGEPLGHPDQREGKRPDEID